MLPENLVLAEEHNAPDIAEARNLLERAFATEYRVTSIGEMTLHNDATVEFTADGCRERRPFTQNFLESLAKTINMPLNYAYDCGFPLFADNFQRRKAACARGVTVCISRGAAINTAPADYETRLARSIDLLDALDLDETVWKVQRASLSDEGMSISFLHNVEAVEPMPGDTIRLGIRLTNSHTGGRYAKATLFTHRLVCSNGAVMADSLGTVWWNSDKRMHRLSKIRAFSQRAVELLGRGHKQMKGVYQDLADRQLFERQFVSLYRQLQYVMHSTEQLDHLLGVNRRDRSTIQTRVRNLELGELDNATPWLVYDMHNRITAAAREVTSTKRSSQFSLRERLEEIGGDLLNWARPSRN